MSSKYNDVKSIIKAGLSKEKKADYAEEVKKARQLFQEMIEFPESESWEKPIDTTPLAFRKMDSLAYQVMKQLSVLEGKDRSPKKEKKKPKKAPLKNTEFVWEQIELVEEVMNNA